MKTQPAITHSDCWYIMQNTDNQLYKSFSQVSGSNGSNTSQIAINYLTINYITNVHRQISDAHQRLAYIINYYQSVHFERLSF